MAEWLESTGNMHCINQNEVFVSAQDERNSAVRSTGRVLSTEHNELLGAEKMRLNKNVSFCG